MTARDSSSARRSAARRSAARPSAGRRSAGRRPVDPSQGDLERETGPTPALRGLGWGLLVAVVAAVVLFSTVLVVQARSRLPQPAPSPVVAASPSTAPVDPTTPQAAPTGPRSGALASSPPVPVPPPGPEPQPGPPATTAPPADDPAPRRPVTEGLSSTTTGLRSVDSRTRAVLVLVNGTDGPVDVEWIDYRGQRVDYGRIDEDEQMVLETFVTHPWIVSDADGEDLGAALPRAPRSTVLVEEPG